MEGGHQQPYPYHQPPQYQQPNPYQPPDQYHPQPNPYPPQPNPYQPQPNPYQQQPNQYQQQPNQYQQQPNQDQQQPNKYQQLCHYLMICFLCLTCPISLPMMALCYCCQNWLDPEMWFGEQYPGLPVAEEGTQTYSELMATE